MKAILVILVQNWGGGGGVGVLSRGNEKVADSFGRSREELERRGQALEGMLLSLRGSEIAAFSSCRLHLPIFAFDRISGISTRKRYMLLSSLLPVFLH